MASTAAAIFSSIAVVASLAAMQLVSTEHHRAIAQLARFDTRLATIENDQRRLAEAINLMAKKDMFLGSMPGLPK